MDEDDANEFKNKINEIIDRQETHHVVLENNSSIIRQSMELTNKTLKTFLNASICVLQNADI